MALKYGLIIGIIYIAITTVINMSLVNSMLIFYITKFVAYVLYLVMLGVFATKIKKANGGYLEFKEAFGVIFVMVLISGLMSYLYNYLYIDVIDPHFMEKIKNSTVSYMEHAKLPVEKIEQTEKTFEEQAAQAKTLNLGSNLLNFFESLIADCVFGLIVSLIVKKPRPMFEQ